MVKIFCAALLLAVAAACAPIHQYQRGELAKDSMQLDGNPGEQELQAHMFDAREGAAGGYGSAGGGCGCN